MGRWEYRVIGGEEPDETNMLQHLDRADEDGWEAVGLSISEDEYHSVLIRRPKAPRQEPRDTANDEGTLPE